MGGISLGEVVTNTVGKSGMEDMSSRTALLKNSTKTVVFPAKIYHNEQNALQKTPSTHTILMTSTFIHYSLAYHGSYQRIGRLLLLPHTSDSIGTSKIIKYHWDKRRKRNTLERQRIGLRTRHIPARASKNSMVSSYMRVWSSLQGKPHLSPSWRPCSVYSTTVLSYRTPATKAYKRRLIKWWTRSLQQPNVSRAIPQPLPLYDIHGYSDTSSEIGIAITIRDRWRAWRLITQLASPSTASRMPSVG